MARSAGRIGRSVLGPGLGAVNQEEGRRGLRGSSRDGTGKEGARASSDTVGLRSPLVPSATSNVMGAGHTDSYSRLAEEGGCIWRGGSSDRLSVRMEVAEGGSPRRTSARPSRPTRFLVDPTRPLPSRIIADLPTFARSILHSPRSVWRSRQEEGTSACELVLASLRSHARAS